MRRFLVFESVSTKSAITLPLTNILFDFTRIDESTNPYDPDARFSVYARRFFAPCPPDPAWYKNAGEPILQGKNCPLPNSPLNPVLPG